MLDLNALLETAQQTLAELKEKNNWSSFDDIQTVSRHMHFVQLLMDINKSPYLENYLPAFQLYFQQTYNNTSFITAHPNSDISLSFYKIAIEAGKTFHLSPFAFIFPGLFLSDDDYMNTLSSYEGFQQHIKEHEISEEELPNYLSSIIQKYLCGEKTLIDKKMLCEDYLFDENRAQRGTFREVPQGNDAYCAVSVSEKYLDRIHRAINDNDLEKYIRVTQPQYDATFKGQLQYLADQLFENGVRGKYGSEGFAGPGAQQAIALFLQDILPKYQKIYQENAKNDLEIINFLRFLTTTLDGNRGLGDSSCVDLKSSKIKTFIQQNTSFLNSLDSVLDKNNLLDETQALKEKLRIKDSHKLLIDKALPLDLYALQYSNNVPLELSTLLANADYISDEALKNYLKSKPFIGYTIKLTTDELFYAAQLHPLLLNQVLSHLITEGDYKEVCYRLRNHDVFQFIQHQLLDSHLDEAQKEAFLWLGIKIEGCAFIPRTLNRLSVEQRKEIFNTIKKTLPDIIKNADDLQQVLCELNKEQGIEVFKIMTDWPSLIKNAHDFQGVLCELDLEQRTEVFNRLRKRLLTLIETSNDFDEILHRLNLEQRAEVFNTMKDERLLTLVRTRNDLCNMIHRLSAEQCKRLLNVLKEILPTIITNVDDIQKTLYNLHPEQCTEVFNVLKEMLPSLIKTCDDLDDALRYFTIRQRTEIFIVMNDKLPHLIKTTQDLNNILYILNAEQCAEVCKALKNTLPSLINTIGHFQEVLRWLCEGQRAEVFKAMKGQLPSLIKTHDQLVKAFFLFNVEQCAEICKALKDVLPSLIKTCDDFQEVLRRINREQSIEFFNATKENLPSLIKTSRDFQKVFRLLNVEQRTEIFSTMKERLSSLIETPNDLGSVLSLLNAEQCTETCKLLKNTLPSFVKTHNDLCDVLFFLSPEQCEEVYSALKEILPSFIKTSDGFHKVLSLFDTKQCAAVCTAMEEQLLSTKESHLENDDVQDINNMDPANKSREVAFILESRLKEVEGNSEPAPIEFRQRGPSISFFNFAREEEQAGENLSQEPSYRD